MESKKKKTFEKAYDFAAELIESEAKRSNYKDLIER